ncbi:MAG: hypothetical protein ACI4JK_03240 [Oscillospiraceae bacterium]
MVKTVIGGVDVQKWIEEYKIDISPVYGGNSFTDVNGEEMQDYLGDKITLRLSLGAVPHEQAAQLADILNKDSVEVEYTTPAPAVSKFKKTAYSAVCSDADPDETDYEVTDRIEWDINVTLESTIAASGGDRL